MLYGVILFPSTHFAIQAEKKARKNNFPIKLIPVPRHLSSDCGICMCIPWEQKEMIQILLEKEQVKIEGIHLLE